MAASAPTHFRCPPPCRDLNATGLYGTLPTGWGSPDALPKLDAM